MIPASVAIVAASRSRSASKSRRSLDGQLDEPGRRAGNHQRDDGEHLPPIDSMYSRSGAGSFGIVEIEHHRDLLEERALAFRVVREQVRAVDGVPALRRVVAHRDDLAAHLVPVADPALVDLTARARCAAIRSPTVWDRPPARGPSTWR